MYQTVYPTAYITNIRSYNERRGECYMNNDSSVQLNKGEMKALERAVKLGIYKAMKDDGLITDFQYAQIVASAKISLEDINQ